MNYPPTIDLTAISEQDQNLLRALEYVEKHGVPRTIDDRTSHVRRTPRS